MKAAYINPFIESVNELFEKMMNCSVSKCPVAVAKEPSHPGEITSLIGLSGPAKGTVALAFPTPTALKMASQFLGEDLRFVNSDVIDAVSELVNIVAGNAKSKFAGVDEIPIDLSLPNVIRGTGYRLDNLRNTIWVEIPFISDLGPFNLRVTFEKIPKVVKNP